MEYKDYYKIMGVGRDAGQDEIKRTYRKLARKFHPDVSKEPNAEARFKEVGEAYEVLKDSEKRAAYDQLGANWKAGQEFHPPPDWNTGFEHSGGGFTGADASAFSDFFESLFGGEFTGGRGGGGPIHARGQDHHAKVLIDLEDAYHGAARTLTLQAPELDAQGRVRMHERALKVRIPKGIKQGQRIRLSGQGSPGADKRVAGDLYLEVEFRPHSFYRIEGRDIYLDLPLAPWEAILGAKVTAPTPTGAVDLTIPAGSASGRKLRLKGRGIPGNPPGDVYVVLRIALPPAGDERAKTFYRKMEQELAFNPRAGLGV